MCNKMKKIDYHKEIEKVVDQINAWIEPKFCKCSYLPLRWLVSVAINGEIGEKYRLLKIKDKWTIECLIKLFDLK